MFRQSLFFNRLPFSHGVPWLLEAGAADLRPTLDSSILHMGTVSVTIPTFHYCSTLPSQAPLGQWLALASQASLIPPCPHRLIWGDIVAFQPRSSCHRTWPSEQNGLHLHQISCSLSGLCGLLIFSQRRSLDPDLTFQLLSPVLLAICVQFCLHSFRLWISGIC